MTEGARTLGAGELLLSAFSLLCWAAAIACLLVENAMPASRLSAWSRPVVGFSLPLALGSQAVLALRRPARSPGWRKFQMAMLALAVGTLLLALWRFAW